MKKLFLFMGLAAMMAMSCSKVSVNEQETTLSEKTGTYVFSLNATKVADEVTKTAYADDKTFTWSDGDQISVLFNDGTNNKFYTLTATAGGSASATFTGTIDDGWTVGSADATPVYYALYPASGNHAYTSGASKPITFYIPPVTDYTASHYSANLPMIAMTDTYSGSFSFTHMGGTYKFVFTDIDVSTVKLTVENQNARALSGALPSDGAYLYSSSNDGSTTFNTISFIEDVTSKTATFYIPYRGWTSDFMPILTLYDNSTGNILKTLTAKAAFTGDMESSVSKMIVVPDISAPGTGAAYTYSSPNGIDWSSVTASAAGRSDSPYDAISVIKAKMDATNLYVYFELKESALYDTADYKYANYSFLYLGNSSSTTAFSWQWTSSYTSKISSWIKYKNALNFMNWNSSISYNVDTDGLGTAYYEITILRSAFDCLSSDTVYVSFEINQQYVQVVESVETWLGSSTQIGFAPTTGTAALTVTAE